VNLALLGTEQNRLEDFARAGRGVVMQALKRSILAHEVSTLNTFTKPRMGWPLAERCWIISSQNTAAATA
jgi:hypothetical protein